MFKFYSSKNFFHIKLNCASIYLQHQKSVLNKRIILHFQLFHFLGPQTKWLTLPQGTAGPSLPFTEATWVLLSYPQIWPNSWYLSVVPPCLLPLCYLHTVCIVAWIAYQLLNFYKYRIFWNKEFIQLTNQKLEISKLILKKNERQDNMDPWGDTLPTLRHSHIFCILLVFQS